ncbi:MAG: M23 family metallopeptidase, partial [Gemmatimonadetes bacterium]|nr:M23 family metallopeptidase [Gemmatimonadota bacterium]
KFTSLPLQKQLMMREVSVRIDYLKRMANLQEKSFEEIERRFQETSVQYLPTISPVREQMTWRSSSFGWRIDPFTGRRAFHSGVDFAGRTGTPIYATADGFVSYAARDKYLGKTVVLDHRKKELDEQGQPYARQGGYQTEYGHLDKILVELGQEVKRGEKIGTMGNTGRSTGPHLHYAVRLRDRELSKHRGYKNPEDFIFDFDRSEDDRWAAGE